MAAPLRLVTDAPASARRAASRPGRRHPLHLATTEVVETQAPSDAAAKDAALARRAAAGDPKAFELLVRRHYERCLRFALHLLGDRRDAEEAVQDTFVRAHRALPGYEERQRFEAWLFRVLVNRCRTMAARRRRMERTVVALAGGDGAADPADERPAETSGWREEIAWALARLSAEQREAFLLRHVHELSYEEMSSLTGDGISALKMRVKRACERLRELLREVGHVG